MSRQRQAVVWLIWALLIVIGTTQVSTAQVGAWLALKGDGTAAYFVSANDETAYIIDGGRMGRGGIEGIQMETSDGRRVGVLEWLYYSGVRKLRIACSHSHADHMGAIVEMSENNPWMAAFDEIAFIDSGFDPARGGASRSLQARYMDSRARLRQEAAARNIPVSPTQGEPIVRSGTDKDLYEGLMVPEANVTVENIKYDPTIPFSRHGHAIVHLIRLQVEENGRAGTKVLLEPDDADATVTRRVAKVLRDAGIRLDVISMPHHGSRSPGPGHLLDRSLWPIVDGKEQPPLIIIAASESNRFSHPHPSTLIECLRTVGPENVRITGSSSMIRVAAGEMLQKVTRADALEQYLRHVRPYALEADHSLGQAELKVLRLRREANPPNPRELGRAQAKVKKQKVLCEEYREVMALMLPKTEAVERPETPAQAPHRVRSDDTRWNAPPRMEVEPWSPRPQPTRGRTSGPVFDELVRRTDEKVTTDGMKAEAGVGQSAGARERRLERHRATKEGRPGWGGITLGAELNAEGWVPKAAWLDLNDSVGWLSIRAENSGEVRVVCYGPVFLDELWSALQFVSPDATMTKGTAAKPGEVGLTSGMLDPAGNCRFALHPAVDRTTVGFDAMRLDHSIYAFHHRAKEPNPPEVLALFGDLHLFNEPNWAYHWYDNPMELVIEGDSLTVEPAMKGFTSVLSVRFWSGDNATGKMLECPPEVVAAVRAECDAFARLDRFARLVALCHWLNDEGIPVSGTGVLKSPLVEFDLSLLPWEVAPQLWK